MTLCRWKLNHPQHNQIRNRVQHHPPHHHRQTAVKWNEMRRKSQWSRRCAKYFEPSSMQARFGFNEHNPSGSPRQWGGTRVISLGKLKHCSMGSGTDESGLGRWTWAQYRGKNNISLRVVSIYQPCANKDGVTSVWAQHKAHLQDLNDDRDLRVAFRENLQKQIQEWVLNQ